MYWLACRSKWTPFLAISFSGASESGFPYRVCGWRVTCCAEWTPARRNLRLWHTFAAGCHELQLAARVEVLHLFPEERTHLLDVLADLEPDRWHLPTVCPGWSVADIARHLLGDDLGRVSRMRDEFKSPTQALLGESIVDLV